MNGADAGLERIIHYETAPRSPREHLALNLMSARLIADGAYQVLGRVYRHEPGVILGEGQSPDDVRAQAARELGYEIARRPTGGSAVVVSPDQALCYSLFFPNDPASIDVTRVYRESVLPFARELGGDIVVEGSYYLRHRGDDARPPLAGHAMKFHHGNSVVQVDGIFHDADADVDLFARLLRLRDLYSYAGREVLGIDGSYFSLDGSPLELPPGASLTLERSERDELGRSKGMRSVGLSERSIVEALHRSVEARFGPTPVVREFAYPFDLAPYLAEVDGSLVEGDLYGQGHCFVDLQEPEPRIRE